MVNESVRPERPQYDSPGRSPGLGCPQTRVALKGRDRYLRADGLFRPFGAMRYLAPRAPGLRPGLSYHAPSGLFFSSMVLFSSRMFFPSGLSFFLRPEGPQYDSPGRSPGLGCAQTRVALKGRDRCLRADDLFRPFGAMRYLAPRTPGLRPGLSYYAPSGLCRVSRLITQGFALGYHIAPLRG